MRYDIYEIFRESEVPNEEMKSVPAYQNFRKGLKRYYKSSYYGWRANRDEGLCKTFILVDENGYRKGSWFYQLYLQDLKPVINTPLNLEEFC